MGVLKNKYLAIIKFHSNNTLKARDNLADESKCLKIVNTA